MTPVELIDSFSNFCCYTSDSENRLLEQRVWKSSKIQVFDVHFLFVGLGLFTTQFKKNERDRVEGNVKR